MTTKKNAAAQATAQATTPAKAKKAPATAKKAQVKNMTEDAHKALLAKKTAHIYDGYMHLCFVKFIKSLVPTGKMVNGAPERVPVREVNIELRRISIPAVVTNKDEYMKAVQASIFSILVTQFREQREELNKIIKAGTPHEEEYKVDKEYINRALKAITSAGNRAKCNGVTDELARYHAHYLTNSPLSLGNVEQWKADLLEVETFTDSALENLYAGETVSLTSENQKVISDIKADFRTCLTPALVESSTHKFINLRVNNKTVVRWYKHTTDGNNRRTLARKNASAILSRYIIKQLFLMLGAGELDNE